MPSIEPETSTEPEVIKSSNFPRGFLSYSSNPPRLETDTPIEAHPNHDPTGRRRDNRWHLQANDQRLVFQPSTSLLSTGSLGIDVWDKAVVSASSYDSWCQTLPYHLVTGDLNKVDCLACLHVLKRAIMLEDALRHQRTKQLCAVCWKPRAEHFQYLCHEKEN